MNKTKALIRTATLILSGAIVASGVNSAFATDTVVEVIARQGVADLLCDYLFANVS